MMGTPRRLSANLAQDSPDNRNRWGSVDSPSRSAMERTRSALERQRRNVNASPQTISSTSVNIATAFAQEAQVRNPLTPRRTYSGDLTSRLSRAQERGNKTPSRETTAAMERAQEMLQLNSPRRQPSFTSSPARHAASADDDLFQGRRESDNMHPLRKLDVLFESPPCHRRLRVLSGYFDDPHPDDEDNENDQFMPRYDIHSFPSSRETSPEPYAAQSEDEHTTQTSTALHNIHNTGSWIYRQTIYWLFTVMLKETLVALLGYAYMCVCAVVVNPGLFLLKLVGFHRNTKYANPMLLLRKGNRIRLVFQLAAACVWLYAGVLVITSSTGISTEHAVLDSLQTWNQMLRSKQPSPPVLANLDSQNVDLEVVKAAVRSVLPNVIPINPETGHIDLGQEVRRYFQEHFVARSELQADQDALWQEISEIKRKDIPNWQQFLQENQDPIKKLVQDNLQQLMSNQKMNPLSQNKEMISSVALETIKDYMKSTVKHTDFDQASKKSSNTGSSAPQHDNDGPLALPDYALATRGARIIPHLTSDTYASNWSTRQSIKGYIAQLLNPNRVRRLGPIAALMPDTDVGQCWPMNGNSGMLGVELSQPVSVKSVTVEYPPRYLGLNMSTSPKDIQVWGLRNFDVPLVGVFGSTKLPWTDNDNNEDAIYLGTIQYDIRSNNAVQTFDVDLKRHVVFRAVLFRILSNWGNEAYTCMYRIRVHGVPAEPVNYP